MTTKIKQNIKELAIDKEDLIIEEAKAVNKTRKIINEIEDIDIEIATLLEKKEKKNMVLINTKLIDLYDLKRYKKSLLISAKNELEIIRLKLAEVGLLTKKEKTKLKLFFNDNLILTKKKLKNQI